MKSFLLVCFILLVISVGFCQNIVQNNIPGKVKTKFISLYPEVNKAQWSREDHNYEARFLNDKARITVLLDSIGNLIETAISTQVLPEEVSKYLSRNYEGEKIKYAEKIISAKGKIVYVVKINNDSLIFSETENPEKLKSKNSKIKIQR